MTKVQRALLGPFGHRMGHFTGVYGFQGRLML